MTVTDQIIQLFETKGGAAYFGEPVSQLEHALEAAWQAEQANASASLVAAALVHDIGHLLHEMPENVADLGVDARHEAIGYAWLARHFVIRVTAPVLMHVAAKRYLCAKDREYAAHLSPASIESLGLQGGAFTAQEARDFEHQPFWREAVRLRRWDDLAKIPGLAVPGLEHYRAALDAALRKRA